MYALTRVLSSTCSSTSLHCLKNKINTVANGVHIVPHTAPRADQPEECFLPPRLNSFSKSFRRKSSYFCIHPEKVKQIIKEKDAATLCNLFASRDYKEKLVRALEDQRKILPGTPLGLIGNEVKYEPRYEHVMSCAQPIRRAKSGNLARQQQRVVAPLIPNKKLRKTTVMSVILNKKNGAREKGSDAEYMTKILPIVRETREKTQDVKMKFRKRSTIMPIFLRKINETRQRNNDFVNDTCYAFAPSDTKIDETEEVPEHQRAHLRSYATNTNYHSEMEENEDTAEEAKPRGKYAFSHYNLKKSASLPLLEYHRKLTSNENASRPSKGTTQETDNSKYKSFTLMSKGKSRLMEPYAALAHHSVSAIEASTDKVQQKAAEEKVAKKKHLPKLSLKKLRPIRRFKKVEKLSESCELNFPADVPLNVDHELEKTMIDSADLNKLCRRNMSTFRLKQKPAAAEEDVRDDLTLFDRVKLGIIDIFPCARPNAVPTEVQLPDKDCTDPTLPLLEFFRHLIRLPKTTPEGYRVLMYSVRDSDPTKMNFNDCVKGFCMYNDCVLSEDGLQEGYIVIFDMKGVQLGHLARVSLPALRCFMLYIQEAHPCRLKSIHVLNTASWIHHIMRLIVPLVKSELLNLVKFHKGPVPEDIPLELLPMDLGGDAPTIDELDRETKSMVHKYHEWMIETAELKSDESKRVKKASWWGFFNGTNKTNNVELDEKTILKNLQID